MDQPVDKLLVIRYFDGLCTADETVLIEEWLKQEGNETQMQEWLWEDWQATSGKMPEEVALRLRTTLKEQIGTPVISIARKWHGIPALARTAPYTAVAAAILAVIVTAALLFRPGRRAESAGQYAVTYRDSIFNNGDQPYKATLTDGSTVWLNTGSVVYIADNFGKSERRVKVAGEAFFEIKQDVKRPFYTEAGNITTHVLGTSYDIEAYPTEKETRVSLLQGRVAVGSADTTCLLSPGEMVLYTRQSGTMQVGAVATADPSAWIKGKIVLNKIALPEALDRLSRLYHVPIQYDYRLIREKYITGEFDHDSLPEVLKPVLFVHNLKFEATGNGGYRIY